MKRLTPREASAQIQRERHMRRRYAAQRRKKAKEENLCVDCLKVAPVHGLVRCAECRAKANQASKEYCAKRREAWRSLELCIRCGGDPVPGQALCGYHAEKRDEECIERRKRNREAGLCPICKGKPEPGFVNCSKCRAKHNRRVALRKRLPKGTAILRMAV